MACPDKTDEDKIDLTIDIEDKLWAYKKNPKEYCEVFEKADDYGFYKIVYKRAKKDLAGMSPEAADVEAERFEKARLKQQKCSKCEEGRATMVARRSYNPGQFDLINEHNDEEEIKALKNKTNLRGECKRKNKWIQAMQEMFSK